MASGLIHSQTLYADLVEFLGKAITAHVHTTGSGIALFDVKHQLREKCPTGEKPVIYYNGINPANQINRSTGTYYQQLDFRVGIISDCDNPKHQGRDLQISKLMDLFSSNSNQLYKWDMTFGNVVYTQTSFPHFGFQNMDVSGLVEFATECKCTALEFRVTGEIVFSTEAHIIS